MATGVDVRSQRIWARVAGLMYWVVLLVDLTGMQLHSALGRSLSLSGALFTIPLAFGLYHAVRPEQALIAASALICRLVEAALGAISVVAGYASVPAQLAGTSLGNVLLHIAAWNDSTTFAAFVFTIGSALFFYLFLTSRLIPRVLSWWGLFSSILALSACTAHIFRPAFPSMTMYAWTPALIAETTTGLWLLIKSVKVKSERSTLGGMHEIR